MPFLNSDKSIYYENIQIPEYSVDKYRNIKLSMVQFLNQDVSGRHLLSNGFDYTRIKEMGYVYLLTWIHIYFYRPIKANEYVKISTWATKYRGVRVYRNFEFRDENENLIAETSTVWVLANAQTHKIEDPKINPGQIVLCENRELNIDDAKKIKSIPDLDFICGREVYFSNIDYNNHMNNSVYSDLFCDHSGIDYDEYWINDYYINFRQEVYLHNVIDIYRKYEKSDVGEHIFLEGKIGKECSFICEAKTQKRN